MIERIEKHLYEVNAHCYCGVFMPQSVMRKLMKLQAKYSSDVKKLLSDYEAELLSSHWAMAHEKGHEAVYVKYAMRGSNDVASRIKLFGPKQPTYVDVYLVDTHDEAKQLAEETLASNIAMQASAEACEGEAA